MEDVSAVVDVEPKSDPERWRGGRPQVVPQRMMPPPPATPMPHIIGQAYHHFDYPCIQDEVDNRRDMVYILSLWRNDAPIEYNKRRCLRSNSSGYVHDIIKFHDGISDASVKKFVQHLSYLNTVTCITGRDGKVWEEQPIWVEIMSGGGSVPSGIEMRSACESSRRTVIPVVSGICASAATFPWTANQKHRLMQNGSILLIHQMSEQSVGGSEKVEDIKRDLARMQIWQRQIEQYYYGLWRPKHYRLPKQGPSAVRDDNGEASPNAMKPGDDLPDPNEDDNENNVIEAEAYVKVIKDLMNGHDQYLSPSMALRDGLATGLFTTYEAEETGKGCAVPPGGEKRAAPPESKEDSNNDPLTYV